MCDVFIKDNLKNREKQKKMKFNSNSTRNIQVITIIVLGIHFIMDIVHVPIKHSTQLTYLNCKVGKHFYQYFKNISIYF